MQFTKTYVIKINTVRQQKFWLLPNLVFGNL